MVDAEIARYVAIGRPDSKTVRAPRSNSSSGYFLTWLDRFPFRQEESWLQSLRQTRPGSEDKVRTHVQDQLPADRLTTQDDQIHASESALREGRSPDI